MEVLWEVVCYHDVCDVAGGFPGLRWRRVGSFCVVVIAGCLVNCVYFLY